MIRRPCLYKAVYPNKKNNKYQKPSYTKRRQTKCRKKELLKKFKVVIDDLMDHYEEYTDEEKAQIKEIFRKVSELNAILDKYDIDVHFDWDEYFTLVGQYFGAT